MTRFRVMPSASLGDNSGENAVWKALSGKYPCLADVLCGVPAADGQEESFPAFNITLFVEGDRLKFCIGRYKHGEKAFGTIQDLSRGLDGLEDALARGDYEWVSKRVTK